MSIFFVVHACVTLSVFFYCCLYHSSVCSLSADLTWFVQQMPKMCYWFSFFFWGGGGEKCNKHYYIICVYLLRYHKIHLNKETTPLLKPLFRLFSTLTIWENTWKLPSLRDFVSVQRVVLIGIFSCRCTCMVITKIVKIILGFFLVYITQEFYVRLTWMNVAVHHVRMLGYVLI